MSSENQIHEENDRDPFDVEPVKVPSSTAEEFLQKLDLADDLWSSSTFWMFRGQNDARWELEPSLFRDWDEDTAPGYELDLIESFISTANIANLSIPGNSLGFRSHTVHNCSIATERHVTTPKGSRYGLQYDFAHVAFAIAQHSGVPTRLLDFTLDPLVAAYFAADWTGLVESLEFSPQHKAMYFSDVLSKFKKSPPDAIAALKRYAKMEREKESELPTDMAVWAIQVGDLQKTSLRALDHPYGEIQFLNSQKGIFLCETENYELRGEPWRSYNGKLTELIKTGGVFKLTLPCTERGKLLDLLKRKRISPLYLKPTYERVAKTIREGMKNQNQDESHS